MRTEPTAADLLTRIKTIQRALTEALAAAIRYDQANRALSIIDVRGLDLRPRVTAPEVAALVADCRSAVDELARIVGCIRPAAEP